MTAQTGLNGRTALITGSAKRVGREIALTLASEGMNIIIHYRSSAQEADELSTELAGKGVKCWQVKADFEKPAEYETLIARALDAAGSLDALVNSASIFSPSTLWDVDFESFMRLSQINAWAPFVLSRDFARLVGQGKIINILDTRISGYDWTHVAYILSKHLLYILTRMTAVQFAPRITVNGIAPGFILPPSGKDEAYLDRLAQTVLLKRHGDPSDVAQAVVYLLNSDFVTGQVINVDGGRHIMEHTFGQNPNQRP